MYSTVTSGQANNHNVSFSARIGYDRDISRGQTIPFEEVLNNDSNAYNSKTGIFTTPVAGKYLFSCTITVRGNNIMDASLMKNNVDKGKLWTFKHQNHYANMSAQYTAIFYGYKNDYFQMKNGNIFSYFCQNIDCGYTLEPPQ